MQHGFNRNLNTCIYVEEANWLKDDKLRFLFKVIDSIHDKVLLSGYDSDAYQKDVFRDHRKDEQEITVDKYRKLKEQLLNE